MLNLSKITFFIPRYCLFFLYDLLLSFFVSHYKLSIIIVSSHIFLMKLMKNVNIAQTHVYRVTIVTIMSIFLVSFIIKK